MAKALPFLQLFLARVRGLCLLCSEDFGQAFCSNTASHQKALWCFELLGHLLLSSHSDTPKNYSPNLNGYISYCWVPMEIWSGPYHQMYCTSIVKGHYSSLLHKVGVGCPGEQQRTRNSLIAVLGVSGIAASRSSVHKPPALKFRLSSSITAKRWKIFLLRTLTLRVRTITKMVFLLNTSSATLIFSGIGWFSPEKNSKS